MPQAHNSYRLTGGGSARRPRAAGGAAGRHPGVAALDGLCGGIRHASKGGWSHDQTLFHLAVFVVIVTGLLSLSLGPPPARYARRAERRAVGQIGGTSYAVAVAGRYAYLGVGPRVVILDVADPAHPTLVGQTAPLPDMVRGVTVVGNIVYVADGAAGLRVINSTNPGCAGRGRFLRHTGNADGVGWWEVRLCC